MRFLAILVVVAFVVVVSGSRAEAGSPVGRWRGSWTSGNTGHTGALRAKIRPTDSGTYKATFAGTFAKVVPFVYRTELVPIAGSNGRYHSEKKMPLLGTYRMDATISSNRFYATFTGGRPGKASDQGIFQMVR